MTGPSKVFSVALQVTSGCTQADVVDITLVVMVVVPFDVVLAIFADPVEPDTVIASVDEASCTIDTVAVDSAVLVDVAVIVVVGMDDVAVVVITADVVVAFVGCDEAP